MTRTIPKKKMCKKAKLLSEEALQIAEERREAKSNRERESEVAQSCPILCDPMDCIAYQAPLSMGFSRQECWSGLPFPSPGDLPEPGNEPGSPALQADTLPSEPPGKTEKGKDIPK